MANYQVNEDTIDVEPGMTWYDVYSALDPYGRTAIGGRLKTIGVPGLTLIGGVSYFINKYGFAMDNIVSYEVVLGDGSQVTTDCTTNPDLFWALKGGGSNFGIVTKFKLKTYSMPHISTTIQVFNESSTYAFTKAVCDWALADNQNPVAAGSVLTITYNVTTKEMSPSLLGVQAGVSNPPSEFKNFTAIPGVIKLHNVTTGKQWASTLDSPKQMFR
jgi:FAD/FMN-containing dehydrogenase